MTELSLSFAYYAIIGVSAIIIVLLVAGICVRMYCDAHQCSCHDPECGGGCPDARELAKTNIWEDEA